MDESADRSGAFHRIRKPDVERELSRFARGAAEDKESDGSSAGADHKQDRSFKTAATVIIKEQRALLW